MKAEDRIEAVDGVDSKNMTIAQVVDRLRGEERSDVLITVRQPGAEEPRTLKATRRPLFVTTVLGAVKQSSGEWTYRVVESELIAYLRIREISPRTPHELRKIAQHLEEQGFCGVILDLRGLTSANIHPAILVADSFLDHGRIGQV